MSTFTNNRPDRMCRSHRPYRPTKLSPSARDRDRLSLIGALFFISLLLAALYGSLSA